MNGRERTRLRKARENGYLDACCSGNRALVHAYGLWCWRLRIPTVWLERRTFYSRYARVHLEMFTSANRLAEGGQAGMKAICAPGNAATCTRSRPTMPFGIMSPCRMPRNWHMPYSGRRSGPKIMRGTKIGQIACGDVRRGTCCRWLRLRGTRRTTLA